jgi:hypothetical protein
VAFETTYEKEKIMVRKNEKGQQNEADKAPGFIVYHVRDGERGKSYWMRLGAAWAHRDGEGYNVQLEVLPVSGFDGRLVLRAPKPEETSGK